MNSVQLIGRLTRDPDMHRNGDMVIAKFSLAIDRIVGQGKEKQTDFPKIVVFGKQAENCEKHLTKGLKVGVTGRIQTGSYKNKEQVTVYTTDVIADRVEFLEWADEKKETPQYEAPTPDSFQQVNEDVPW